MNFLLEGKEAFSRLPTKEDLLIGDSDLVVNPCPNHPAVKGKLDNRESNWLCLTEHQAICDDCCEKHKKKFKKHTILDLRTCINESRSVLCNLEGQIWELIHDNETQVARGHSLLQLVDARKKRYKEKQEQKLERAIKALRLQMEKNVQDYDEIITTKFSKVVRTT